MKAKRYAVELKGETPLLMHPDDIAWADVMDAWRKEPANKKEGKAGDDRCPAWRWLGNLYHENGVVVIPADNLMTMLRDGGKKCPTGKGKGTFKSMTQSGIIIDQSSWPLLCRGKTVDYTELSKLRAEDSFAAHQAAAFAAGFELFVKRAKVGTNKHIRVRPRFDKWACAGSLTVLDPAITTDDLQNILSFAGAYAGLCDWRPGSPMSPGRFGMFSATIRAMPD